MKQALIIGGTSGTGKATAQLLLKQGIEVFISGRKNKKLETTVTQLSSIGKIKAIPVDLADINDVKIFAEKLKTEIPHLKYLVNAAGYFSPKPFLEHTEEDYDIYHQFNKAFFFITQAAANIMKKTGVVA